MYAHEPYSKHFMQGLKKNTDFSTVYKKGRSKADRNLILYRFRRDDGIAEVRFGVSVSKKVGNSVVRHRIKRRLKEIARLHPEAFQEGFDYVVIARNAAAEADYAALERSLRKLL